jgi:hypothetical protein
MAYHYLTTLVQWSILSVRMLLYMCPHTTVYEISQVSRELKDLKSEGASRALMQVKLPV